MAGHNPDSKVKPFENHAPGMPWTDPQAMNSGQIVEARKLEFKTKGRPSIYSDELAEDLCALIAEGHSIKQACKECNIHISTFYEWVAHHKNFSDLYARASQIKIMGLADEILEIADDGRNDWQERETKSGQTYSVPDQEVVNRSRLRVDSRRWLLAKLMPRVYGEKITLDVNDKHAAVLAAARARIKARQAEEDERTLEVQADTVADDNTITPADVTVIEPDSADIMDE